MQARLVITAIETECITQAVIDEITSALGTTVRVEVRADGSTFTEVAVATPPTPTPAAADQPPSPPLPALAGAGFQPGEEVALAYVVIRRNGDDKGNASHKPPAAPWPSLGGTSRTCSLPASSLIAM